MLKRIMVGGAIAGASLAAFVAARQWWKTWGIVPDEGSLPLPGDDLVPDAIGVDTRGITIEAAPEQVWPWLVQMGFGRGGWYSVDRLDVRGHSAERIVDEWQNLAVGDVMPTHPGGGFEVRILDPGKTLVLYGDPTTMQPAETVAPEDVPAGLAATGAILAKTPTEFRASWAFVLQPLGTHRTRLIERLRYWGAEETVPKGVLSLFGFGVFVMVQRHLVGLRTRAERLAIEESLPTLPAAEPPGGNGHAADVPETVLAAADPT